MEVPWTKEGDNLLVVPSASGWGVAELGSTVRWESDIVGVGCCCCCCCLSMSGEVVVVGLW
jgi:hypothetical protein